MLELGNSKTHQDWGREQKNLTSPSVLFHFVKPVPGVGVLELGHDVVEGEGGLGALGAGVGG